jgi:hypothetical protein
LAAAFAPAATVLRRLRLLVSRPAVLPTPAIALAALLFTDDLAADVARIPLLALCAIVVCLQSALVCPQPPHANMVKANYSGVGTAAWSASGQYRGRYFYKTVHTGTRVLLSLLQR